jgi:hypothetical protein
MGHQGQTRLVELYWREYREPAPLYEGDVLTECPGDLDFSVVYAVIVSGDFPNPCGHALLFVPKKFMSSPTDGSYFQVAGVYTYPRIIDEHGYRRYLRENKKKELDRYAVPLLNPETAQDRLEQLAQKKWAWLVLPHNCAAFVEDVASAGGSTAGLYSNCPRYEAFR